MPPAVEAVAGGPPVRVVWEKDLGGLALEVREGPDRVFVKWAPASSGVDLGAEVARLRARAFTPVARVLAWGADESRAWMVTAGLPGDSAVSDLWKTEPGRAVAAVGAGLRAFHDDLPVDTCPFSWSTEWNYGPGWDLPLLAAYGIAPDT